MTVKNILKNMKNSVSSITKNGSNRKFSTLRRKLSTPRLQKKFPSPKLIKKFQISTSNFFKKMPHDFETSTSYGFSDEKIDEKISESCDDLTFSTNFQKSNYENVMERARKASQDRQKRIQSYNAKHISPPIVISKK